jgi:hypothetical protein
MGFSFSWEKNETFQGWHRDAYADADADGLGVDDAAGCRDCCGHGLLDYMRSIGVRDASKLSSNE